MKRDEAKGEVARLVEKLNSLTKREFKKYDEENTKKDFILPLFRALGWATEDRREVTAEDKVSRRRVDYAFRIEGIPKFFLEAKPLKADLDNPEYAWQAINYAWTKGVTWAVLTDFEGLRVYNAQWKGDKLRYNLFKDMAHTEYIEKFDELWLLSRECFERGLLDIEAEKVAKKAKREPVGKELFDDLIAWRQRLYRQLRGWEANKKYTEAQIDEAVQRILDRFIFIRTAEDRELEERVLLPAVREWRENGRRRELDSALVRIFRQFDEKYDSELFEIGHFCEELVCDSTTYAWVIEGLYGMRDEVPTYNFDAIDVDVLGGIYEQYLSYRQGLPEEVEEAKRARRKKRGIYYTPKFVVQYIVENTVGRLLQERSHDQIRKLRILDPACGSGSFLIEAFDRLDRYHQEARGTAQRSDEKAARDDFLERLRILRDNIYGVDLDPQAVEIARLNLLLKALYQRALLPKLENNIRCGNSLISGLPIELSQYFGAEWEPKRPFNWEEEFPKIMEEGGFDVVIGNPPYVSFGLRGVQRVEPALDRYLRDKYPNSAEYKLSQYAIFMDRGLQLLRDGGYFSFIVPDSFLLGRYFSKLRRLILDTCAIKEIVLFSQDFWESGTVGLPVIIVLQKVDSEARRRRNRLTAKYCTDPSELNDGPGLSGYAYEQSYFERVPYNRFRLFFNAGSKRLVEKMEKGAPWAKEIVSIHTGVRSKIGQKKIISKDPRDVTWHRGLISGREIKRYSLDYAGWHLHILPKLLFKGGWDPEIVSSEKLLMRQTGDSLVATLDTDGYYHLNNLHSIIPRPGVRYSLKYLLGILNSKLMNHYYHLISLEKGRTMAQTDIETIEKLPIRRIDFDNPHDVKMHDGLVALVERILDLHKRLKEAVGEEKKDLERQIARVDRKIDDLVYELYGITEEERKIIEAEM